MPRLRIYYLTRGMGVCVLLLVLLYMYMALRREGVQGPEIYSHGIHSLSPLFLLSTHLQGSLDQGKPLTTPSTYQQEPLDQGKPVTVTSIHQQGSLDQGNPVQIPPEDVHPSSFLNIVNPVSLSTNKTSGAANDNCIQIKTVPTFHICLYPLEHLNPISRILNSTRVWEPQITKKFQMALRKFPQATVIDVGANIGYYGLLAAAMDHPVVAVEPTKFNMEKLAQGVQLNGFADKVYVVHNALAESYRNVSLTFNKIKPGFNKVVENKNDQQTVQTILMDDLIPLIHTRNVVIIMDIEGYECHAIAGSTKLFHKVNVTYVFMEWGQLYRDRFMKTSACPVDAILRLTEEHFDRLGYIAHNVQTNRALDPHSSPDWRAKNVYWRHKNHPPL